jgi:hypothetical protein
MRCAGGMDARPSYKIEFGCLTLAWKGNVLSDPWIGVMEMSIHEMVLRAYRGTLIIAEIRTGPVS